MAHELHADPSNRQRIRELETEISRLQEEAQRIINRSNQRQTTAEQAQQAVAQAESELNALSGMAHEFFAPGQRDVVAESLNRCRSWISAGMTDAAAAYASVALSQARLLSARIQDAEQQWVTLFNACAARADALIRMLDEAVQSPYATPAGTFLRDADCLNYFSSGLYGAAREEIDQLNKTLLTPARTDLQAAFRSGTLPPQSGLSALLRDIPKIEVRCSTAVTAADREMYYSDERSEQGQRTAFLLQNEGYTLESSGFDDHAPLNPYTILAGLADSFRIRIRFVPVRRQGIAVSNIVTVECIDCGYTTEAQGRMLVQVWQKRLLNENPSAQIIVLNDKGPGLRKKLHLDEPEQPLGAAQAVRRL
ncbi:MAG: hypothetical protein IJE08_01285 [Clostridia bacterium]|nr:hypothetical protein [Clostridia bacterium]